MTDLKLWDYQMEDARRIATQYGTINGSKPGTGKTAVALAAAAFTDSETILVVCPKVAFGVWQSEAKLWQDYPSWVYTGTSKQRAAVWESYMANGKLLETRLPRVLITNIAQIEELQRRQVKWDFIAADEVHNMGLLTHTSKAYKQFSKFQAKHIVLMTGTPIRRGPQDLWTLLHLCNPKQFPSYWAYINRYCIVLKDYFGQHIEPRPKNVPEFTAMLKPYFIRRSVDDKLPGKYRQAIPIELEGEQKKMYDELQREMILEMGDQVTVTPNIMTLDLRLRQLVIAPQAFGAKEPGIMLTTLCDMVFDQFLAGNAVTICTPFKMLIPYIMQALRAKQQEEKLDFHLYQIHGDIKERAADVAERFQKDKHLYKALIYTIKSGTSFTAHSACIGFFLGYEWSTIDNLQAEDRIYRLGQTKPVMIYYLLAKGTIDQAVMEVLDNKQTAANWILTPGKMLEAYRKLQEKGRKA